MKYKLIVSDIDGTLISKDGKISKKTKQLVKEYTNKGGNFSIATGRMEATSMPFVNELDINTPIIVYNGSAIYDINSQSRVYELKLEMHLAKTALKICRNYSLDPILYQDKIAYINKLSPSIKKHVEKEKVGCTEVGNLITFLEKDPIKILFIGDPSKFKPFTEHLSKETNKKLNLINSEINYLELLPNGASKGNALRELSKFLRIPIEETIAIGDERNDVSMIKTAGIGVAVKNATIEPKTHANYITDEDSYKGVEEILYKAINDIEII